MKKSLPVALALIKKLSVEKASSDKLKAAILPPVNSTSEPVICPEADITRLLLSLRIAIGFTTKPAIDADLKVAKPVADIDDEALASVDCAPAI